MQAWFCETLNGADGLVWKEVPTPEPRPEHVRVAIRAASLNFPDILIVQGKYQVKPDMPFVPGSEYAGIVDALGDGVTSLKVGDPVAVMDFTGGFSTHAIAPVRSVLKLPTGFPLDDAAAFVLTYGTTHHALVDRAQLRARDTVLVLGAAGGVGTSAIQVAKAVGAKVIAAASSDEKCAFCRALGADETINYSTGNVREALKELTDGKGPDVVYDPVGGDLAEPVFRSIAWRGRYLVIGFAQGAIPALPLNLALLKGASIVGVWWGDFVRREPENSAHGMAELARWYAEGKIKPAIDLRLPMRDLPAAYARMATRKVQGKVLLIND